MFDGKIHWFDLPHSASLTGKTKRELGDLARAGKLQFKEDMYGNPYWFAEPEITEIRRAHFSRQEKSKPRPRDATPEQLEARWAKISEKNAKKHSGSGLFTEHHLRMTLPIYEAKQDD